MAWIAPIFFDHKLPKSDSIGTKEPRPKLKGVLRARPDIPEGFEDVTQKNDASWAFVSENLDLIAYADRQATEESSQGRYALVDREVLKSLPRGTSVNEAAIVCSDDWDEILDAIDGFQNPSPAR